MGDLRVPRFRDVKEALLIHDSDDPIYPDEEVFVGAARLLVEAAENSELVWWCAEHERTGNRTACSGRVRVGACPMKLTRLVAAHLLPGDADE